MRPAEYRNIYKNEKTHFFYRANHSLFISLVERYAPQSSNLKILDAGCGTGLLAAKLKQFGKTEAIDINPEAIKYSRRRGIIAKKASVENIPFGANHFDIVVCLDVIYHAKVKSDQTAIGEFYRVLKPGGILLLRVPANKWLIGSTDKQVETRQRYSFNDLKNKLKKANFKILKISYINFLLLTPSIASWVLEKITNNNQPRSPLVKLPSFLNNLLAKILMFENLLLRMIDFPAGLGLIAVVKKPKKKK